MDGSGSEADEDAKVGFDMHWPSCVPLLSREGAGKIQPHFVEGEA